MSRPTEHYRGFFKHPVPRADGRPRFVQYTCATREEVEQWRVHWANERRKLKDGIVTLEQLRAHYFPKGESPILVEDLAARYLAAGRGRMERNIRNWLRAPGYELIDLQVGQLVPKRLNEWLDTMRAKKHSADYIKVNWRILSAMVRWGIERGIVDRCPWEGWRPGPIRGQNHPAKLREAVRSVDELIALLAAARAIDEAPRQLGTPHRWRLEPRLTLCSRLGLGQGELAGLKWSDFDERGEVSICRQYDDRPLKAHARMMRLACDPVIFEVLALHRADVEARGLYSPTGPVFPDRKRSLAASKPLHCLPLTGGNGPILLQELRRAVARAGLPNPEAWTVTSLRRGFATLELQALGGDLATLKLRTRHATDKSMMRYLRPAVRGVPSPAFMMPPREPGGPVRALPAPPAVDDEAAEGGTP